MLCDKGFDFIGFDPAYEGSNPLICRNVFVPGVLNGRTSNLILRHVLEHIEKPIDFLNELKVGNSGSGKLYIEVPCFDWICDHKAWFDVFYEHVNYFRLSDFYRMFGKVIQSGKLFNGQYLYVIVDLSTLRIPKIDKDDKVDFPRDFIANLTNARYKTLKDSAIWGGGSKGVIFALLRKRAGFPVRMVIDINPKKQGKYLPGTGLKVVSPKLAMEKLEPGSTIFVMNSNYLEEIKQMSNCAFNYIGVDHEGF